MIEYRPLVYVAPSGGSMQFVYDGAISDSIEHFTSTFKFSGTNGSYKQDKSIDSGDYNFTVFLTGDNRIDELRYLRTILNETSSDDNRGRLEHPDPTIGTLDCVVNNYSVDHNIIKNINTIIVTISFSRTIANLKDGGIDFSAQDIYSKSLSSFEKFALEFKSAIDVVNGNAISATISQTLDTVNKALSIFNSITSEIDEVAIAFQDSAAQIISTVDSLARAPEQLANAVQNLLTLPVLFGGDLIARVNAFVSMIESTLVFTDDQISNINASNSVGINYLASKVIASNAALTGFLQTYSITESTSLSDIQQGKAVGFSSKAEIQQAINNIINNLDAISLSISEKSVSYSNINFFKQYFDNTLLIKPLVKSTIANLQNRFSLLPVGRGATLPYDESPVVLCALIYNTVDIEILQFFYDSNNIHGDEMYLLKKGRRIIWYGDNIFETSIFDYIPTIVEPELDIWQDTPWDSGNEQIQDQPWLMDDENVQDTPIEG